MLIMNLKYLDIISSLNIENNIPPYYYNTGSRRGQILHARLRMRCSSLKQHLYLRNIEPSPLCTCGKVESCFHFLLECTHYDNLRTDMLNSIDAQVSCNLLLYGDPSKPCAFNSNLFKCVENYILQTKRFDWNKWIYVVNIYPLCCYILIHRIIYINIA